MRCAVLGNGPSRSAYKGEYDYVIGCNIPWTKVDSTFIMDPDVITAWSNDLNLITCKVYLSPQAVRHADRLPFIQYKKHLIAVQEIPPLYSSGHVAAKKAVELGYTELDIYGMDSWFNDTMETYTRTFVSEKPSNKCKQWRKVWNELIQTYPDVKFNFIKE
jgi:hypothetical protein